MTDKKRKVLFVATVVKKHIMEFHVPYLKMLQENGWETSVAANNDYENPSDCKIPYCDHYYNIEFDRSPFRVKNIEAYRKLKQLVDSEHYDVVHCHTPVGATIARLAAKTQRKNRVTKVIYSAHGFHFFKGAPKKYWITFYPVEKYLSRFTDAIVTENTEDFEIAKTFHAKHVYYALGVGIDRSRFSKPDIQRENMRIELGICNEDFVILSVAELIPRKNQILILKALNILKNTHHIDNIKLIICGTGELENDLKNYVFQNKLEDNVLFLGYRNDLPNIYNCCDVFVCSSLQEGLPVAMMEAMASGLSVICTKIRGVVDVVSDHKNGILIENDETQLADVIKELYANRDQRTLLGKNAQNSLEKFDIQNVLRLMKEVYLDVLK